MTLGGIVTGLHNTHGHLSSLLVPLAVWKDQWKWSWNCDWWFFDLNDGKYLLLFYHLSICTSTLTDAFTHKHTIEKRNQLDYLISLECSRLEFFWRWQLFRKSHDFTFSCWPYMYDPMVGLVQGCSFFPVWFNW